MGKVKSKKKTRSLLDRNDDTEKSDQLAKLPLLPQAMDGHNVSGWTDFQIKAYNELLVERGKLEKQRQELEQRSAKSQAGRALLNDKVSAIDSVFKQQKLNGDYKFTGDNSCCVDIDSDIICHHEICTRSKTGGLTYAEMDTIKYYYMRILAEKSDRMRNALRKQRDLELIKLKKDEDQDRARSNQKLSLRNTSLSKGKLSPVDSVGHQQFQLATEFDSSILSGATQETQRLVTNILEQLDHLRSELQNGQITSSEMQKKLDIIDAEMQAAHLKTEDVKVSSSSQRSIMPQLTPADSMSPTTSLVRDLLASGSKADTYAKAFHIMESFLSASKPSDFQHAVAELKGVLRLSGPMCKELQGSFDALEGIFDNPDRLSFNGPDGKQECTSIIDLMEKMKETLHRTGELPEGANADLVKVFQTCIDLETEGKQLLHDEFEKDKHQNDELDLASVLSDIRESLVSKSPIPPLTEKTLEEEISILLANHDAMELITKAEQGIELGALEGHITSMVMNRARKDPEKYIGTINKLASAYDKVRGSDQHQAIADAFPKVTSKMESFVTKLAEKRSKEVQTQASPTSPAPPAFDGEVNSTPDILDQFPKDTAFIATQAVNKFLHQDHGSAAHLALRSLITEHGSSSLWSIWLLFAEGTDFREDYALQEQSRAFEGEVDRILADKNGRLRHAVLFLYDSGACPGTCAAIVSEVLASTSEYDSEKAQVYLQELASFIDNPPTSVDTAWVKAFRHLSLAMLQIYIAVYVNVEIVLPTLRPDEVAFSAMAMLTTYICLINSSELASHNLELMCLFLGACLSHDGVQPVNEIVLALKHYELFSRDGRYRCLTVGPCTDHFPRENILSKYSSGIDLKNNAMNLEAPRPQTEASAAIDIDVKDAKAPDNAISLASHLQTTIHSPKLVVYHTENPPRDDTSMASALYKAAALYEATSQQAKSLMRFPLNHIEQYNSSRSDIDMKTERKTPVMSKYEREDPHYISQAQTGSVKHTSKFSEHTDASSPERPSYPLIVRQNVPSIDAQITEAIATGQILPDFHDRMVRMMIRNAFSGRFPNPLATYEKGIGPPDRNPWPRETYDAILEGRQRVQSWMDVPQNYIAWTAKRMKHLLSLGGSHEFPSGQAMSDLAQTNFSGFEEYAAFLAREKARIGEPAARIKELCDEVYDLLTAGTLVAEASSMKELSEIAEIDWQTRLVYLEAASAKEGDLKICQVQSADQLADDNMSPTKKAMVPSQNESSLKRVQDAWVNSTASHHDNTEHGGQKVLNIHLQKFLTGLQTLDKTRGAITSFTGSPDRQNSQPRVFEDLMGKLSKTKEIVNDVVRIIAEQKDRSSNHVDGS